MSRLQRTTYIFLISLHLIIFPAFLMAAPGDVPFEMLIISTTPIGPTPALCAGPIGQYGVTVIIVDQPVWYTMHGPSAVPSASVGALGGPGTVIQLDFSTQFKAIRQGAVDARGYVVCIPK